MQNKLSKKTRKRRWFVPRQSSQRNALAECVTTRGETTFSPAVGTPSLADDLSEDEAVVAAVVGLMR